MVKSFFVQTESALEGTPYTVFWYDSVPTDYSKKSVNVRKKFHRIDYNDWTVQVIFDFRIAPIIDLVKIKKLSNS